MADDRRQLRDELIALLHGALCAGCGAGTGFVFASADGDKAADALLPLIDRVAAEAAAEALIEVADDWIKPESPSLPVRIWLRARAAQFRAAPTVTETQETSR